MNKTLRFISLATAILLFSACFGQSDSAAGESGPTEGPDGHAVISIYHHVDANTPAATSLSPEEFRTHMEHLRDNDFTVWRLDRLLEALENQDPIPDRTVSITFDDGYISIYEVAFPMLEEFGFPWALFLSTEPIDNNQRGYMNWDQIREMSEAGVMMANHMVTHPHMIDPQPGETDRERLARMRGELLEAEQRIADETGQNHQVLAYPYGEYDMDLLALIEEEGFVGLAQNSGAVGYHSDMRALPRFPLAGIFASMNTVPTKLETLAFEVQQMDPRSPMTDNRRPAVTLQLAGDFNTAQLGCYAGTDTLEIEWLDEDQGLFRIQPERDFNARRFGYNCTAPRRGSNRFYWFSKFWTRSTIDNQD